MPLPFLKIGVLFVKQFSKRLSNHVKEKAKRSRFFRQLCIKPAQFYHGFELDIMLRNLGFGKATKKQPLNPDRAVELGADMIGEFFLYAFLVTILMCEYSWSQSSSEKKKLEEEEFRNSMKNKLDDQSFAIATLEAEVRQMQRTIGELESSNFALMEKCFASEKKSTGWFKG